MNQFRYVISDIRRNKRTSLFYIIQLAVVLLLLVSTVSSITSTMKGYNAVKKVINSKTYILANHTSDHHFSEMFANEGETVLKLRELYMFSLGLDIPYSYSQFSYVDDIIDGIEIKQYTVDNSFLEIFNIRVVAGRTFTEEDFSLISSGDIPILVGYNLKDTYQLGQTYSFYDGGTGELIKCRVIGVLENNAGYYDLYNLSDHKSLNYSYIKPMMHSNINELSFSDIDMAISSTVYFSEDTETLQKIAVKSQELGLFTYSVETAKSEVEWFVNTIKEKVEYELTIAFVILIFAAVGMSANLSMMVTKNMKEYSIHILCGGMYRNIATRLVLQLLLISLVALLPTIVFWGISLDVLYTLCIMLFVDLIILSFPLYKLYSIHISELLRRFD